MAARQLRGGTLRRTLSGSMSALKTFVLLLVRLALALGQSRADLILENVLLRQQLDSYRRKKRPSLEQIDRLVWTVVREAWSRWIDALVFVRPDTVVRWHREAYRAHRRRKSQRPRGPGAPADRP